MIILYISIFIVSFFVLFWAGSILVESLMGIAKYLGWREFVVAFFVMAAAGSVPNLFVGINAALQDIPELSFAEIAGGNVVVLTLSIALAVLMGGRNIFAGSKLVQTSAIFTSVIAVLPLILIFDGVLSRTDGFVLLLAFFFYTLWLFSKEDRFRKIYNQKTPKALKGFKDFLKGLGKAAMAIVLLLIAAKGVVASATVFSSTLNISIPTLGILIVGLGNSLPDIYFAVASAKRKQTWMILGNAMGSVIFSTTFVLGIVAIINPIEIYDFSPYGAARFFLIIAAIFFLIVIRTGREITRKEALVLLAIYILFVVSVIVL